MGNFAENLNLGNRFRPPLDFYILWIKTNVAYTRLEMIAKQRSALQV